MTKAEPHRVEIATRADWRAWLTVHHGSSGSIWLVFPRKAASAQAPSVDDIVEEALCFGWIDSLPRKLDDKRSMLLLSPRRAGSNWSGVNKARVARMMEAGLMTPAGLQKIEAAKGDGSWDALNEVDRLEAPQDLLAALDAAPPARQHFEAFPPSTRRGILEWILNARQQTTRAARIADTAAKAQLNQRANQWRKS